MKLNGNEKDLLKEYKDILSGIIQKRIEDLKEDMIAEEVEERDKIIEAIRENKRWLTDIERETSDKKPKIDTGV